MQMSKVSEDYFEKEQVANIILLDISLIEHVLHARYYYRHLVC